MHTHAPTPRPRGVTDCYNHAAIHVADVQAYLNGVENPAFKNFFTVKTFVAKVIGSALAVGSSLVMGKEGPMLHAGSILAVILGEHVAPEQQLGLANVISF